ncbi:CHASE2 domain-containing protein [Kovacikia minuta CCNUW1]|uniref:CHASE2 domain-containing protein n=1 Tax=Kovacikia minuta TaxID=2931930 RepID=UPI001CCAB80B|nr:CHASE2 domain-containing protein [Kovacikia minuta]UBF26897.1 CHASE2 domain-containing protein [Kovacikia minuta CCNUW1]
MTDVFISYSRKDKEFVRTLHTALKADQRETWVDWEDIPLAANWWAEIEAGIEAADTFIFVISPDSVVSTVCQQEIEHAIQCHKRLMPIFRRDIDMKQLHPTLSKHNALFFREQDDFDGALNALLKALDTDLDHARAHTRLLVRAIEWEREGRDPSFLLRGKDLAASEQWLKQAGEKEPNPTDLQIQYITTSRQSPLRQAKPRTVLLAGVATSLLVLAARLAGILQPLELKAFDHLMRSRPPESPDPHLLIVELTEEDIQAQIQRNEKGRGKLSDDSLSLLLKKLEPYQPRLIGLDLYRDFKVDERLPDLAKRLQQSDRLIFICKTPEVAKGQVVASGTKPPPEVPIDRVGFSDVLLDPDDVVRRQLVVQGLVPNAPCATTQSFSFLLARRYLELEKGKDFPIKDPLTAEGTLQLGGVIFPRLGRFAGGYQGIDDAGFQLLLNYRAPDRDPAKIATSITLAKILQDQLSPEEMKAFKNRIVLIGSTSFVTGKDYLATPYQTIPGVKIQAQMISQLLSAVLENRPLLQVLPRWVDVLWISLWSAVGGVIVYYFRSPLRLGIASGIAIAGLYLSCLGGLILGHLWIPLIPSAIALLLTGGSVLYWITRSSKSNGKG